MADSAPRNPLLDQAANPTRRRLAELKRLYDDPGVTWPVVLQAA